MRFIFFVISFLLFIGQTYEFFFLPTLPLVGATLGASKYMVQLAMPLLLLSTACSYLYSGVFSDRYGSKNTIFCLSLVYSLGVLISLLSTNIYLFLLGFFVQGLGASYAITITLIYSLFSDKSLRVFSILSGVCAVFVPITIYTCGYINYALGWRYVFILMLIISLIAVMLLYFIESPAPEKRVSISKKKYIFNVLFYIKHIKFNHYVLVTALISSAQYVFYTLASYIFIIDFHLTSKQFGALMIMPSIGLLIGSFITAYMTRRVKRDNIILFGVVVALLGSLAIVFVSLINSSAIILMAMFTIFIISLSLVSGTARLLVAEINIALVGFAGSFFAVILNSINWLFSHIASQQDGEVMGLIMVALSFLALILHVIFQMLTAKKSVS